jgi:hypothetical protein
MVPSKTKKTTNERIEFLKQAIFSSELLYFIEIIKFQHKSAQRCSPMQLWMKEEKSPMKLVHRLKYQ